MVHNMNKENLPDLIAKVALRDQQAFRNLYQQTSGKLLSIAFLNEQCAFAPVLVVYRVHSAAQDVLLKLDFDNALLC